MLKRVSSPHVARLFDYLESPWGAAIVLEAVAGRPLRKILDEHDDPLSPEGARLVLGAVVFRAVLAGLKRL